MNPSAILSAPLRSTRSDSHLLLERMDRRSLSRTGFPLWIRHAGSRPGREKRGSRLSLIPGEIPGSARLHSTARSCWTPDWNIAYRKACGEEVSSCFPISISGWKGEGPVIREPGNSRRVSACSMDERFGCIRFCRILLTKRGQSDEFMDFFVFSEGFFKKIEKMI